MNVVCTVGVDETSDYFHHVHVQSCIHVYRNWQALCMLYLCIPDKNSCRHLRKTKQSNTSVCVDTCKLEVAK